LFSKAVDIAFASVDACESSARMFIRSVPMKTNWIVFTGPAAQLRETTASQSTAGVPTIADLDAIMKTDGMF